MSKYIDAEKLKKAIEDKGLDCSFALKMERLDTLALIDEFQREQPEVDIIPLPEGRMVSYINYCLHHEDDEGNCPTCGKYVTGLRLFPYYYDRENNDVYFASVCPECGKIIISKE